MFSCSMKFGDNNVFANITVIQAAPISEVFITPNMLRLTVGSNQTLTCTTDAGRPNARVQWYLSDGTNLTSSAAQQPDCGLNCSDKVESTSTLVYIGELRDHDKSLYCIASNIDDRNVTSRSVNITIVYGPSSVVLTPSNLSYTVIETADSVGPVTCAAECRPNCTIIWVGPGLSDGTTSVLHLQNVNRNQTGDYQCIASNDVGSMVSGKVSVDVNYAPNSVVLSPSTTSYTVNETTGSVEPIICTADCRPNCTITWSGPYLPGIETSTLELLNVNRNHSGDYQCTASNNLGNPISGIITVVVNYGPSSVVLSPSNSSYKVLEYNGNVGPITCTADCRPNCTITWSGPNLPGGTLSELNLQNINRIQAGVYQCAASNGIGSLRFSKVTVVVNFVPTIDNIDGNVTYYENDTAELRCRVESIPTSTIRWMFSDGNDLTILPNETKSNFNVNDSLLIVSAMNCLSSGLYTCKANNSVGETNKTLNITVLCAPKLNTIEYEIRKRIAVADKQPLNITTPVLAFPKPWFYWQFCQNNSVINITDGLKSIHNLNRHFSNLVIENMTRDNFGTYTIYAGNGLEGNKQLIETYIVEAARRPTKPTNITCSSGHNYIILNWQPEFNGGSPQSFRVFYKNIQEKGFNSHPDNVSETNYHPVKVQNLLSSSVYLLTIHTVNIFNTTVSEGIKCNTTAEDINKAKSLIAVGVGAGVGSAVVVIIAVLTAFLIIRRIRTKTSRNDKVPIKGVQEEDESGDLKDNPLYVSSVDDAVPKGLICGPSLREKKKEKRITNTKQKKQKVVGNNPIEMEGGCVYENHDGFIDGQNQIYANQLDNADSTNENEKTKNKDGLMYAELDFAPVPEHGRFVIRGIENRNTYALIDLNKKADPLLSDDEDNKQNDIENKQ